MKILMSKTLSGQLKPCYDSYAELLKKIKAGDEIECEIKKPRNLQFLKKFFALMNLVLSNQELYNNVDDLRKDLTIAAGFYTSRFNFNGDEVIEADSISFAKMNQETFDTYYQRILDVICKHMGFTEKQIQENIVDYF